MSALPVGSATPAPGPFLASDHARFLRDRVRAAPEGFVPAADLFAAYADHVGVEAAGKSHVFRAKMRALLPFKPRLFGTRWIGGFPGIALVDALPDDAVAPFDLTDAAQLRAVPFDQREAA